MNANPHMVSVVIPVYRDAARARNAVAAMLRQALPSPMSLEVIVVDDGSGDGTAEQLARLDEMRMRLLSLPRNVGRSAARNAGATAARGAALIFMDCDCLPIGDHFAAAHMRALTNAVASSGRVAGNGSGFWDLYQREASVRRERQHASGVYYAGSSQNLAVRTAAFNTIGGFDVRYRKYGFEDRDLLIRLAEHGDIAWTTDAEVRHMDALTLQEVSGKMRDAGRDSSVLFARDHPDAYRALGYASLDSRLHRWLRPGAVVGGVISRSMAVYLDDRGMLERLPYSLARLAAKTISGMAYLAGTAASRE